MEYPERKWKLKRVTKSELDKYVDIMSNFFKEINPKKTMHSNSEWANDPLNKIPEDERIYVDIELLMAELPETLGVIDTWVRNDNGKLVLLVPYPGFEHPITGIPDYSKFNFTLMEEV